MQNVALLHFALRAASLRGCRAKYAYIHFRQPQKIHFQKFGCDRRAGSSLKEANTSSIRLFSFLPALGLAQIFFIKAIFFGCLRSYAYFVELTSSFFVDIVVNGVARLQNVASLHFALRAASPRVAAQNTLLFTSFIRVFCRTDFVSSHCLLSINKGPRKGVLCLSG